MANPSEEMPFDPLLQPGSYIIDGPSSANLTTPINTNTKRQRKKTPIPAAALANTGSNDTPPFADPDINTGIMGKRKRKKNDTPVSDPDARPAWLPDGWNMLSTIRQKGTRAGATDRYYVEPKSGRRLRSRVEVQYFLQTGLTKRNTITSADGAVNVQAPESSEVGKKGKSKKSRTQTFNYKDSPKEVTWKMTDPSNDTWMPYIEGKLVPASTRKVWERELESASGTSESASGTFESAFVAT